MTSLISILVLVLEISSLEFSLPEDYDKETVPKNPNGGPLVVRFKMEVERFLDIDSENNLYSLDFWVFFEWKDERLQINESAGGPPTTSLNSKGNGLIWTPTFFDWYMRELHIRKGIHEMMRITIKRDKTVLWVAGLTVRSNCKFDFFMYPFDFQCCVHQILSYPNPAQAVKLKWGNGNKSVIFIHGERTHMTSKFISELDQVPDTVMLEANSANFSTLLVYVKMRRQTLSHILEVYVPSALFVIISWGSFLVKPSVVPGRMVLLVTNLLTLVTMFEATRSSIPPSLKVKAVDIWYFSCIMFVFCALLEYAWVLYKMRYAGDADETQNYTQTHKTFQYPFRMYPVDRNTREDNGRCCWSKKVKNGVHRAICSKKRTSLDKIAIIIFPLCFVIMNLVYWFLYISVVRVEKCILE